MLEMVKPAGPDDRETFEQYIEAVGLVADELKERQDELLSL
jgi:hypothetical protein